MEKVLNKILEKIEHLDHGLNSLRNEMNERFNGVDARFNGVDARFNEVDARFNEVDARFDGIDARLEAVETTMHRIESGQQEDIHSILILINKKLEDTATKADIESLRHDIEFNIRENSLFKLELDRIKRNNYE